MPLDESSGAQGDGDADSFLREAVDLWEPSGIGVLPALGLQTGEMLSDRFVVEDGFDGELPRS
jgi:hypothetical protein